MSTDDQASWLGPDASRLTGSVPMSALPPGAVLRRPIESPPSASTSLSPLSASFTAAAEQVPAVATRIRVYDRGEMVGQIEVMHQRGGRHLVVGEQEWQQPEFLAMSAQKVHFTAVADRLLAEAVALADRLGASLSTMLPGSLSPAERLAEHGFHRAGDMWFRERPGSVIVGAFMPASRSEVA